MAAINNLTDKDLLVNDLIRRLPTGVICQWDNGRFRGKLVSIEKNPDNDHIPEYIGAFTDIYDTKEKCTVEDAMVDLTTVKPYLRKMSSMTFKERYRYENYVDCMDGYKCTVDVVHFNDIMKTILWLDSRYLDWNDLIHKDLALSADNPRKSKNQVIYDLKEL